MWQYDCMCVVRVRWWFSFVVVFFLAFISKCSHFVVVATNICYNIPESHSFFVRGSHALTPKIAHRVDFPRALTFQPTNLILLANSIGCALMLLYFSNSLINSLWMQSVFFSIFHFFLSYCLTYIHFTHTHIYILHTFFAHIFISYLIHFLIYSIQFFFTFFLSCLLHGFCSATNQPTVFLFINAIGISWRLTVLFLSWTYIKYKSWNCE